MSVKVNGPARLKPSLILNKIGKEEGPSVTGGEKVKYFVGS
jgi:hypothetical protein